MDEPRFACRGRQRDKENTRIIPFTFSQNCVQQSRPHAPEAERISCTLCPMQQSRPHAREAERISCTLCPMQQVA